MRKMKKAISTQTRRVITALAALVIFLVLIPVIFTLYKEGRFSPSPKVTVVSTVTDPDAETLVFAADYDFEPYSFYDSDKKPSGLNIELATEIANRMGKKVRVELGTWPECKAMIQSSEADVLLGLEIFADESKTSTLKTIPISHDEIKIFGKDKISNVGSLYGKRVGIASQSIITKLFELNCEYVGYNTNSEILHAVASGEVDYGICHASVAAKIIERDGLGLVPSVTLMESFPAMGIRETAPELKEPVNQVIKEMSDDGTVARLYEKWLAMNVENKSFKTVLEGNFAFYITYLIVAVFVIGIAGYLLSALQVRENNLKTALSYQKVLEEEKKQAEAANRAKSAFLFNMSHDIRTPMNAILGFSDIAIQNIDDREKALDALNKAKFSGKHMLSIINDILDMSSIESGKIAIQSEAISVGELAARLEEVFRISMEQKGLRFVVMDDTSRRFVDGDAMRITQVVSNLLSNAMKFTKPGGTVLLKVCETPGADADHLKYQFCVKDTGIGISKEFSERIFEVFEREKTPTVSGVQGAGLGLSIAKNLAELMGGSLSYTSEVGKGSEFVFSFEGKITAEPVREQPEAAAPAKIPAGKRLLLAEDNALNREIAENLLTHSGFIVESAENGEVAVSMVSAAEPGYYALVLMDIQMPVMDGYEATKRIRSLADPLRASIPILAMTANAFAEDRERSIAAGMNGHIAKPIDAAVLLSTIQQFL
jgi:signal transduction histidine kinase/ActR/RegA family two-component response regulator